MVAKATLNTATEQELKTRQAGLSRARLQLSECLILPLRKAILHRQPIATAQIVWQLPMECAAAGFKVTQEQVATGWRVSLYRKIDARTELSGEGKAASLMAALVQMTSDVTAQIEMLESDTRTQMASLEVAAEDQQPEIAA